ncbi:MAG TPA: AzlC family ABC transporter permease [Epulopiscium sp.]|nr:AzlC family ABC transporter permease [Candidatus Epulonipiscium sp.]
MKLNFKNDFTYGMKRGLPICLGYIPVSFTFGLMVVDGGLSPWLAIFISLSNVTSAGQFAGLGIILQNGSLVELGVPTLIINLRYMLMSLSLSQKIDPSMSFIKRALISYGVTDEIFAVASIEARKITFAYMCGLIIPPVFGWTAGTAMGAVISSILPRAVQNAMGITLYAMFIAIIVPVAKKSKQVAMVILIGITINSVFTWSHLFDFVSGGWKLIIATVVAASLGAFLFPVKEVECESL